MKQSIRMAYKIHLNVAHFYFRFSTEQTRKATTTKIEPRRWHTSISVFSDNIMKKRHTNVPHAFNDIFPLAYERNDPNDMDVKLYFFPLLLRFIFGCCYCCYVNVIRLHGVVYKMKVSTWHEFHTKSRKSVNKHLDVIFFFYFRYIHICIHVYTLNTILCWLWSLCNGNLNSDRTLYTSLLPFRFFLFFPLILSFRLSFISLVFFCTHSLWHTHHFVCCMHARCYHCTCVRITHTSK